MVGRPDDYQWERAARLSRSQNGTCKALKHYRFTVKKDFPHRKGGKEKRLRPLVYIGESGFRKDFSRSYGYVPRGQNGNAAAGAACVQRVRDG